MIFYYDCHGIRTGKKEGEYISMHTHTLNDQQILAKLAKSPQQGLALLMEQYTGLIWHIAASHLHNPEDIKECVNETFARFYFQREKYDPEKASLTLYLASITRNLAISRYRKEQGQHTALSRAVTCSGAGTSAGETAGGQGLSCPEDRLISLSELRADVEKAMETLQPDEAALIRMKYYGGMTTKEIAASLGLPYETVKKRHHRSLKKLRRSMLLSLILLALLLLSACTYCVLRHYNIIPSLWEILVGEGGPPEDDDKNGKDKPRPLFLSSDRPLSQPDSGTPEAVSREETGSAVPGDSFSRSEDDGRDIPHSWVDGYGPVLSSDTAAYSLAEEVHFETEYVTGILEDAVYAEGNLKVSFLIQAREGSFSELASQYFPNLSYLALLPDFCSIYQEDLLLADTVSASTRHTGSDYQWTCLVFSGVDLPRQDSSVELSLTSTLSQESLAQIPCELGIPFTLTPAPIQETGNLLYELGDDYSILAVPRRENGSLVVSLCPFSADGVPAILSSLIWGSYGSKGEGEITLAGEDGSVYTGTCVQYSPGATTRDYYDWDFGPVPPGNYTLHIPYLYLSSVLPEDFSIPIDLETCTWEDKNWTVGSGSITVDSVTPIPLVPGQRIPGTYVSASDCPGERAWKICLKPQTDTSGPEIFDLFLSQKTDFLPDSSHICNAGSSIGKSFLEDDPQVIELLVCLDTFTRDPSSFCLTSDDPFHSGRDGVNYRWNVEPAIPLTVE